MSTQQASRPTLLGRADWLREALDVLTLPGGVVELRCPKAGPRGTISGYFDDPIALAKEAARLSGTVPGVYLTLNPCAKALLARCANRTRERADLTTGDRDIVRRRWLPIDVDPVRPSGIGSTDDEHDVALARAGQIAATLAEQGWPEPLRIDSGNGAHLLYRIDEPNDAATTELVKRCLAALAARFDDERARIDASVYNAARIWKLPGTLACKGDSTADRPHRLARILRVPERLGIVSRELLEPVAAELPQATEPERGQARTGPRFDLPAWLARYGLHGTHSLLPDGRERYRLEHCPFDQAHGKDAAIFVLPSGALAFKCLHNGCQGKGWAELRERFEPSYRDRQRTAQNGAPAVSTGVDADTRSPRAAARPLPRLLNAKTVLATDFPEPKWAIPGILPEGLSLLVGAPKQGKSWLALAFAIAIASGGRALGGVLVDRGSVLYAALEDTPRRLQDRLEKLLADGVAPSGLDFYTELPRLAEGGLALLEAWLERHSDRRLVILDTWARVRPTRQRNGDLYSEDYGAAALVKELADRYGVAVLLIHHRRKAGAEDVFDTISGSNGLLAAADAALILARNRGEAKATLHVSGRDVDEQEVSLAWDGLTAQWTLTDDEHNPVRRLVAALEGHAGRMRRGDVQRVTHLTSDALDAALKIAPGVFEETERGTGRPSRWIVLNGATKATKATKVPDGPAWGEAAPATTNPSPTLVAAHPPLVAAAWGAVPDTADPLVALVAANGIIHRPPLGDDDGDGEVF